MAIYPVATITSITLGQAGAITDANRNKFVENVDNLIKLVEQHLITISNLGLDREKVTGELKAQKARIKDAKNMDDLQNIAEELQKIYQAVMERMIETAPGAEIAFEEGATASGQAIAKFKITLLGPGALSKNTYLMQVVGGILTVAINDKPVEGLMKRIIIEKVRSIADRMSNPKTPENQEIGQLVRATRTHNYLILKNYCDSLLNSESVRPAPNPKLDELEVTPTTKIREPEKRIALLEKLTEKKVLNLINLSWDTVSNNSYIANGRVIFTALDGGKAALKYQVSITNNKIVITCADESVSEIISGDEKEAVLKALKGVWEKEKKNREAMLTSGELIPASLPWNSCKQAVRIDEALIKLVPDSSARGDQAQPATVVEVKGKGDSVAPARVDSTSDAIDALDLAQPVAPKKKNK